MSDGEKMVYAVAFVKHLSDYHHNNRHEGGAKFAAEQARCAVEALRYGVTFSADTADEQMWREMVELPTPPAKQRKR